MELTCELINQGKIGPVTRQGFTDEDTGERFLVWHVMYDQLFQGIMNGDLTIGGKVASEIAEYYVLVSPGFFSNKYVFIEKDGTVRKTNKPLCFFDVNLFKIDGFENQMIKSSCQKAGINYQIKKLDESTRNLYSPLRKK